MVAVSRSDDRVSLPYVLLCCYRKVLIRFLGVRSEVCDESISISPPISTHTIQRRRINKVAGNELLKNESKGRKERVGEEGGWPGDVDLYPPSQTRGTHILHYSVPDARSMMSTPARMWGRGAKTASKETQEREKTG
jgi:hypothetical protein